MKMKNIPKIELHVHLDGSLDIELAKQLSLKDDDYIESNLIAKDKCENLNDYLTKFDFPCSLMQSKENLIKGGMNYTYSKNWRRNHSSRSIRQEF